MVAAISDGFPCCRELGAVDRERVITETAGNWRGLPHVTRVIGRICYLRRVKREPGRGD